MKVTQEKAVFYMLYKSFKQDPNQWVPIWKFVGELHIPELNMHYMMSYKTPTNGPVIYFDNPGLVERRQVTGKSGSTYYEYRIAPNPSVQKIVDKKLQEFYLKIK